MKVLLQTLKRLIPAPLKRAVKEARVNRKLRSAVRRIEALPPGNIPSADMLIDLQIGWSNDGYVARTDYLKEVARHAAMTSGPILECGSGLTTILIGLLAGRRGVETYSLEHIADWRARVNKTLERFQIPRVQVLSAPLKEYKGFAWYGPPLDELPKEFALVVCDGPPGETEGGRYGLVPVMGECLPRGSVILLDDTERPGETEVLRRWRAETNITVHECKHAGGSFAVITRIESSSSPNSKRRENDVANHIGKSPTVSVIIPAYNVAPFIGETLDSVFAQTFTDFEVIVINDGSPDTEEFEHVLGRFKRLRYLKQENRGASSARNAGLRAAHGEFVAFLDADDRWLPNYLSAQMEFVSARDCDLVCADALVVGDSPDAGRTYFAAVMPDVQPEYATFLELLSGECSLITSGVVARREPIFDVGLFDETLRNAQDFDLWLRLVRAGMRLAYQKQVLLHYRARSNSLTGDAINSHQRELRIFEKIEHSYELTPEERLMVEPVIRKRRALLYYELGKLYLLPGDFARARESFARSDSLQRSLKTLGALWFARLAPRLMRSVYAQRSAGQLRAAEPARPFETGEGGSAKFQEQT